jgi:CRP-like cAMP-binding protein
MHHIGSLAPMAAKLSRHSPLSDEERGALLALPHRLARLPRRKIIVREGDITTHCCVLLKGFASRHKVAGSGAMQMLSVHVRGDLIDLQNSIVKIADHGVETLTDVDVAFIPHNALVEVADQFPAVGRALLKEVVIDGSITREWLLNVGHRNSRQRVAHLLCELAIRQEAAGICEGPRYICPISQEQLGQATGITSVHVNRTVQALRAEGLIAMTTRDLTILDWHGLQAAGDFNRAYLHETGASIITEEETA